MAEASKDISIHDKKEQDHQASKLAGEINSQSNIGAENTQMEKFHASQGHGFAAERANHLYDRLFGRDAAILGDDNAKNGADRMVDGTLIQSKYCQNATQTINAAFKDGQYRYMDSSGNPMQLEVPSDQYDAAINVMKDKISSGQVPGVTDPEQAGEIVRKGHFTYDQAVNLAKSNTIESLTYDAVNGAVIATNAFGITATITFALSCWNGDDFSTSLENAVCAGMQVGGTSFLTNIAVSQLNRVGVNRALVPATNALVKAIGPQSAQVIANSFREGANIYGAAAMNNVAKLIRCNAISAVVMTVVLSASDVGNAFRGRISAAQLFKNVAETAGGITAASAGAVIGIAVAGPVGGLIMSMIGGMAGSMGTREFINKFIEDDSVQLVKIIEGTFCNYILEKLMTAEEMNLVLNELANSISAETLLEMYASPSQKDFARNLVETAGSKVLGYRSFISIPDEAQMFEGLYSLGNDYESNSGLFGGISSETAIEVGKRITGIEYSERAASMAYYAAKQMNLSQKHGENALQTMKRNNETAAQQEIALSQKITYKKQELPSI